MKNIYLLFLLVFISAANAQIGSPNPDFNTQNGANGEVRTLAIQPDGKIIAAGLFMQFNGQPYPNVVRLNPDGSVDTSFSAGLGTDTLVNTAIVLPDGSIIIAGAFNQYNGIVTPKIAKLNSDGSLDTNFASAGANANIVSLALQPDGKIIVAGTFTSFNGELHNRIVRINANGTTDNSFNSVVGADSGILTVELTASGKMMIGGTFTSYGNAARGGIARINSDGSLDNTFDPGTGINGFLRDIAMHEDGRIVIAGSFTDYNGNEVKNICRLFPNGQLDTSLDVGSGPNSLVTALSVQPDNKILIGGFFSSFDGHNSNGFACIFPNGDYDNSFTGTFSGNVHAILTTPDGEILLGGSISQYNGTAYNTIVKVKGYCNDTTIWNGNSWSGGAPVDFSSSVIINGDMVINDNMSACSLVINSGNVIIEEGATLSVLNGITVSPNATLTVNNNANITQIREVSNSGVVTVKKSSSLLYRLDYTLWSSPVSGQNLQNFSPQTLSDRFYTYNPVTNQYNPVNASNTNFEPGKGYLIRMPNSNIVSGYNSGQTPINYEGSFIGTLNNGKITYSVTPGQSGSYFAVGNPYASPINIYDFFAANAESLNSEGVALYFWRKKNNPNTASYATITKLAYTANNDNIGGDTGGTAFDGVAKDWVINPGQGFIVRTSPSAQEIVFNNSMRRSVNNAQFFNDDNFEDLQLSRIWINLKGTQSGQFSQAAIGHTSVTTNGMDFGWDGLDLDNDGAQSVYTLLNANRLKIQARGPFNLNDVYPLGYRANAAGNYTLSLSKSDGIFLTGQNVFLKDNLTGLIHNLSEGDYNFETAAGSINDRFTIMYTNQSSLGSGMFGKENIVVYKQRNDYVIATGTYKIARLEVYDMRGRLVVEKDDVNSNEVRITPPSEKQVFILRVTTTDNFTASRQIIN